MLKLAKICQRFSNKYANKICFMHICVEYEIPNVMMRLLNLVHLNFQGLHKSLMQLNFCYHNFNPFQLNEQHMHQWSTQRGYINSINKCNVN